MTVLRAALVTPLTGPLAGYGRAGATALQLWAEGAAALPAPLTAVDLAVHDAHPDPGAAIRRATAERPDVVFGPYGSSPALAAVAATDRLVWNHGGATSALCRPAHANVVNVPAPASTYLSGALQAIRSADPDGRTALLLAGTTGFAADVAAGALATAATCGFAVTEHRFEPGRAAEAAVRYADAGPSGQPAGVLLVVGGFEDEIAVAEVLLGRAWRAAVFVAAGVEEILAPVGAAREGLLGPAQWLASAAPRPDLGPDATWFVDAYRRAAGSEPPYPAAQAFAAGLVCARCLVDAGGPGDEAMLAAAERLDVTTLYGRFRLDTGTGLQAGHEVLTVQWQDGRRRVVWPPARAEGVLAPL
ncbi:MAG TPA: ABC transporter substrate-binding protein [Acidimicrobiia bacterium]|nr:ABC transporter substrate-binding protein [Acidimicrobiia bacterium]